MKYLVTGATGFIGQHLCRRLVEDGSEVVAVVRSREKAARTLDARVELIDGDLSLFEDADLVLPRCDVVVHLAGLVAGKDDDEYNRVNYEAVCHLLDCIERQAWKPRRLLFSSSLAAGGPSRPDAPLVETSEPRPIDAYGRAKLRAEERVRKASFPTTSFRPCIVLGPGDPASLTLFRMARAGWGFSVSGVDQVISTIDVSDLVNAIVKMAEDERPQHAVYYVSHGTSVRSADLFVAIGRAFRRRVRIVSVPRWALTLASRVTTRAAPLLGVRNQLDDKQLRQLTQPAFLCSSELLQSELGWRPSIDLEECLTRAVSGYRSMALL